MVELFRNLIFTTLDFINFQCSMYLWNIYRNPQVKQFWYWCFALNEAIEIYADILRVKLLCQSMKLPIYLNYLLIGHRNVYVAIVNCPKSWMITVGEVKCPLCRGISENLYISIWAAIGLFGVCQKASWLLREFSWHYRIDILFLSRFLLTNANWLLLQVKNNVKQWEYSGF